jgi:branched-chain amino acid transport system substrate-binding protein
MPGYYSENNYSTAMWFDEAMKKAGGKFPGPEEFIKIMQSIKLDAPRGPLSMDDMRNPIENVYIKKVEKTKMFGYEKEELWNTVIKTYPNVSQFWTYGKEKFLAQPVYDRDFPPCKFCD